jgi:hypothetical protein
MRLVFKTPKLLNDGRQYPGFVQENVLYHIDISPATTRAADTPYAEKKRACSVSPV